jgi:mannose-6-phosphate isomerase-like protein (cupin superfamily)
MVVARTVSSAYDGAMKNPTRRDLCTALPVLALLGTAFTEAAHAAADTPSLPAESATYSFDKLPVNRSQNGAATRTVFHGKTPTGEVIELHETTLMPGQMPHPPHKHIHTELMLIREGTVEFIMGDKSEQVGPGGVCYAASNTMHGLKNIGVNPANYFVIAIGTEAAHA